MDEGEEAFKIVRGKPTRKRSLESPRCSWEDIIRGSI